MSVNLVIGAGGIGKALIDELLSSNASNKIVSINSKDLDVRHENYFEKINALFAEHSPSWTFFCVGVLKHASVLEINRKDAKEIFEINTWSIIELLQAFNKYENSLQQNTKLMIIVSMAAFSTRPYMQPYAASKCAALSIIDSYQHENPNSNVQAICPGWIQTSLANNWNYYFNSIMSPQQAAKNILKAAVSRNKIYSFPSPCLALRLIDMLPFNWKRQGAFNAFKGFKKKKNN